ncbi:hypothetical protein C3E97_034215, partial [Pseudomonas sp. MWU12-2115]
PPPGIRLVRGQPSPRSYYGERLDGRALWRLPLYPRYESRRTGRDLLPLDVGTGIVSEILDALLS